ncbi:MAG: DUF1704 domain-containing protein [Candidatus Cloacimonetes bacterium]|nr:DUF1704 domain-containing protein [Candidatus Cloacimonadota bacterium]
MTRGELQQVEFEAGRHALPAGGTLVLEPALPYLLVYREPPDRSDPGTARLIAGEACWIAARRDEADEAREIVRRLAQDGSAEHGAFLVIELWTASDAHARRFVVRAPAKPAPETSARLVQALESVATLQPGLDVTLQTSDVRHPPGLPALFTVSESWEREVLVLGLEVPPIFRDPETGAVFPRFLRQLRRALSHALRKAVYEFVRVQTSAEVTHHLGLGARSLPDVAWSIDRALCTIERSFDVLLLTAPVNEREARARFEQDGFAREPQFHYRLLPMDPDLLKRQLFALEMEDIDDPAIADLFQDKRDELDTLLTMLGERDSEEFRFSSQRLYGTVSDSLLDTAQRLLAVVPAARRRAPDAVDARAFRDRALAELDHYRTRYPALSTTAEVRPDVRGLLVSRGNLLIGQDLQLDPRRVAPLIHHEVGTHVLTYVNGSAQPLEQLALGLAGYDELQEGLAVLAEYLAGGLDRNRMRLLAARVIAARSVEDGATFVDTFRLLRDEYGYTASGAWQIAVRVHQSGGFTRDFIYLRGLIELLALLQKGVALDSLYIGKIAQKHIPIIQELRYRRILRDPPLKPRVLEDSAAQERLAALRNGIDLTEMVCPEAG